MIRYPALPVNHKGRINAVKIQSEDMPMGYQTNWSMDKNMGRRQVNNICFTFSNREYAKIFWDANESAVESTSEIKRRRTEGKTSLLYTAGGIGAVIAGSFVINMLLTLIMILVTLPKR